jgi:hypothetical protein
MTTSVLTVGSLDDDCMDGGLLTWRLYGWRRDRMAAYSKDGLNA